MRLMRRQTSLPLWAKIWLSTGLVWALLLVSFWVNNGGIAISHPPLFSSLRPNAVAQINVITTQRPFQIKYENGMWHSAALNDYPIDGTQVVALIDLFANVRPNSLGTGSARTKDPALYDRLGVGQPNEFGTGTEIQFLDQDGRILADGFIGNRRHSAYIRSNNGPEVYFVASAFAGPISPASFIEKPSNGIEPDEIASISLSLSEGPAWQFRRDGTGGLVSTDGQDHGQALSALLSLDQIVPQNIRATAGSAAQQAEINWGLRGGSNIKLTALDCANGWVKIDGQLGENAPEPLRRWAQLAQDFDWQIDPVTCGQWLSARTDEAAPAQ